MENRAKPGKMSAFPGFRKASFSLFVPATIGHPLHTFSIIIGLSRPQKSAKNGGNSALD